MLERHPYLDRRPEYYFTYLNMSVNARCNNHCTDCCGYIDAGIQDIPIDKLRQVLKAVLADGNINEFYPSCYAEATLYPHLNEMVRFIGALGRPRLNVRQDTNCRIIPDGFIEAVNSVSCGYDVGCSLWAADRETYRKYHGADGFDTVVMNIRTYLHELDVPPSVSFPWISDSQGRAVLELLEPMIRDAGYKMQPLTSGTMPAQLNAHKAAGRVPVFIRNFTASDGETNRVYLPDGRVRDFLPFNNCDLLFKSVTIKANGNIMPCGGMDKDDRFALGSIYDYDEFTWNDLVALYHTDKARRFLAGNFSPGTFASDKCRTCTMRICNN